jgi:hypothetical protein
MLAYLQVYYQPLIVLVVGLLIVTFVARFNVPTVKARMIAWLARKVFRNGARSNAAADQLFMHISVLLLVVGLLWIGMALGYLTN